MKYLIIVSLVLGFSGCLSTPFTSNQKNFIVRDNTSQYGMKYHFILQTTNKISDMHNPFSKFYLVTHYHIYTNKLGKVSGDKILFAEHDNTKAKQLSKNSTFIFNSDNIIIENLKICLTAYPHCSVSPINNKYFIKPYSMLKSENGGKESSFEDKGYYQ